MSLQFISGNSGSGKSHYLYQQIVEESIRHPEKNYLVLVPEQFTMQTQKDLCMAHPRGGIMNIDVLSFGRLAHRVFEEPGKERQPILDDVGKNLVAVMFRSAGFKVIDLGVDISEKQFLRAVKQNPDVSIVCISSLLSTSIPEMEQVVKSLKRSSSKHKFKIMVGGGAVTKQLAKDMGADAYTENCIEAVEVAKTFIV